MNYLKERVAKLGTTSVSSGRVVDGKNSVVLKPGIVNVESTKLWTGSKGQTVSRGKEQVTCPDCEGTGDAVTKVGVLRGMCIKCLGTGKVEKATGYAA